MHRLGLSMASFISGDFSPWGISLFPSNPAVCRFSRRHAYRRSRRFAWAGYFICARTRGTGSGQIRLMEIAEMFLIGVFIILYLATLLLALGWLPWEE